MAATSKFKEEIDKRLLELQTLRDEVRVRLHLGGLEAKSAWDKLEPRIQKVERDAEHLTDTAATTVQQALTELRHAYEKLKKDLNGRRSASARPN